MTMRTERKELDWHLGDIEQRCGFKGGKYTDVNLWFAFLVTALLTGAFFIGICHVPSAIRNHPAMAIILARGWTPYAMVSLFVLAIVMLFVKWRKLSFQRRAFKVELIPVGASFALTQETALDVLKTLNNSVDEPKRFVLFNRIERALLNLKNVGNVSDVSEMLRASAAIGGFGAVLNAEATAASLRESLIPVTGSLSVAFDTTFLALVLAMVVQMAMTFLRRKEDQFLDACRDYAHGNIISRLRFMKNE